MAEESATSSPPTVRPEAPSDHAAVEDLQGRAFGEPGIADLVRDLRAELRERPGLSLVAELDGGLVGHVMFTTALLDAPARLVEVMVLSPLGVAPGHQRRGIGGLLVRRGLELVGQGRTPLVFLEGSPRYYPRFGFRPGAELGFRKPSLRIPDAAFQVFLLDAYEPWMSGTLVYPAVFWKHDAVGLRQ